MFPYRALRVMDQLNGKTPELYPESRFFTGDSTYLPISAALFFRPRRSRFSGAGACQIALR